MPLGKKKYVSMLDTKAKAPEWSRLRGFRFCITMDTDIFLPIGIIAYAKNLCKIPRKTNFKSVLHFVLHKLEKVRFYKKNDNVIRKSRTIKSLILSGISDEVAQYKALIKNASDRNRTYARGSGGHCSIH